MNEYAKLTTAELEKLYKKTLNECSELENRGVKDTSTPLEKRPIPLKPKIGNELEIKKEIDLLKSKIVEIAKELRNRGKKV